MIGIVILNYSTFKLTTELVESLQNQTISNQLSIVVVDNFSDNNSFEKLKPLENKFDNVKVIKTDKNIGYARGNNFGIQYIESYYKVDYIAIINNDVILTNDCFEILAKRYMELDNPAIIAPVMINPSGRRLILNKMNSFFDDICYLLLFLRLTLVRKRRLVTEVDNTGLKAMKVDVISGSFMFSSLESFKKIGYFNPSTFLYAEERFIAKATKDHNLCNYIILDNTYIHNHSETINKYHNLVSKHKMLYDGWYKFTIYHRKNAKIKGCIFKLLSKWSLFEWKIIEKIKN